MSDIASAAIGAGGSLLGGLFGLSGASSAQKSQEKMMEKQLNYQREFAQNGIRWKVEDGKAAGLHPLAAIGAQGASYTPVSTSSPPADYSFLGDMGQQIGSAVAKRKTQFEREIQKMQLASQALEQKKQGAEIEHLNALTARAFAETDNLIATPNPVGNVGFSGQGQASPKILPTTIKTKARDGSIHHELNPDLNYTDTIYGNLKGSLIQGFNDLKWLLNKLETHKTRPAVKHWR